MLTEEQLFKVAFLSHLADLGIGPQDAHRVVRTMLDRIEKQADAWGDATGFAGAVTGGALGLAEKSLPWAIGANIAIPAAIGATGGYALSKMQDVDDEDPAELRTRESIQNYRRLSAEMEVRRRLRDNRAGHTSASRPLVR